MAETGTGIRFKLLGPLRVEVGLREIPVTASRDRTVLAALLLSGGDTVTVARLVEAVWGERPPRDARNQVQACVSRIRKWLAPAGAEGQLIVTDPAGYRILIKRSQLDLSEFRTLREAAGAAAAEGRPAEAVSRFRAALALWRGRALAGIDSELLRAAATALDEELSEAHEACIEVELTLGRAGELVSELTELVQQRPHRESLHGFLMVALYRAGRPADALAAYRRVSQRLREDLGTEPGLGLQRLHQAILAHDPGLHAPPAAPAGQPAHAVPRELPSDVAGFAGRVEALAALDDLAAEQAAAPGPVVISVIAGSAGVGKTALAVHWSHRVAARFPDGQVYLNLRGYASGAPLRPIEALSAILRSLGAPPEQIPVDQAEATTMYRTRLAGRRLLIVLDNAGSADQVRPLLPGSPTCLVLVTSRDRLSGLVARDGARRLGLDVLSPDEAYALLSHIVGAERVAAEPEATAQLAHACAYLPLALRIAAAHIADHPARTIGGYVGQLGSDDRLSVLQADDDEASSVLAALGHSYRGLPAAVARLFRLLGLVPCPDFTVAGAAALAAAGIEDAERWLRRLAGAHLVEEHSPGRYSLNDLLRLYAGRLAGAEDGAGDRAGAVRRLVSHYLFAADTAATVVYGERLRLPMPPADPAPARARAQFSDPHGALAWLEAERANLVIVIRFAADRGLRSQAWLLADRLRGYFWNSRHSVDWQTVASCALAAAAAEDDSRAQAAARLSLADLHLCADRYPAAIASYRQAAELAERAGWVEGHASIVTNLGIAYRLTGQLREARACYERALAVFREIDDLAGLATTSLNLGTICLVLGQLREAAARHGEALGWYRQVGAASGEASALRNLAAVSRELGRLHDAAEQYEQAVTLHRQVGDRSGEISALSGLAQVHSDAGRHDRALSYAETGRALGTEVDDRRFGAVALVALGTAQRGLGHTSDAVVTHQRALDLTRETGDRFQETEALLALAADHGALGDHRAAAAFARRALDLAREVEFRLREGSALAALARSSLGDGGHADAEEQAHRAVETRLRQATRDLED